MTYGEEGSTRIQNLPRRFAITVFLALSLGGCEKSPIARKTCTIYNNTTKPIAIFPIAFRDSWGWLDGQWLAAVQVPMNSSLKVQHGSVLVVQTEERYLRFDIGLIPFEGSLEEHAAYGGFENRHYQFGPDDVLRMARVKAGFPLPKDSIQPAGFPLVGISTKHGAAIKIHVVRADP